MPEIDYTAKALLLKILSYEFYIFMRDPHQRLHPTEIYFHGETPVSVRAARLVGVPDGYDSREALRKAILLLEKQL